MNMIEVGLINGLEFATLDCQPIEGIKDLGLGNEGEGIKGLGQSIIRSNGVNWPYKTNGLCGKIIMGGANERNQASTHLNVRVKFDPMCKAIYHWKAVWKAKRVWRRVRGRIVKKPLIQQNLCMGGLSPRKVVILRLSLAFRQMTAAKDVGCNSYVNCIRILEKL